MSRSQISFAWRPLQAISVVSALAVIALLFFAPEVGLYVTWYILIPLVPVLLLVAPMVWRNLCPIAVLSQLPDAFGIRPRRPLPLSPQLGATVGAVILFLIIVPLRPALFNVNGPALAIFTLSVVVVAVVAAFVFPGKAGWCASLCPVLPVERIYGQSPMIRAQHAHCSTCDSCIRACYDLRPSHSIQDIVSLEPPSRSNEAQFLRTPMGIFTAGFPGFIVGYFTLAPNATVGATYLHVLIWFAASAVVLGLLQLAVLRNRWTATRALGALAAGLYYWFTVPSVLDASDKFFEAPPHGDGIVLVLRVVLLALVGVWLLLSLRGVTSSSPAVSMSSAQ